MKSEINNFGKTFAKVYIAQDCSNCHRPVPTYAYYEHLEVCTDGNPFGMLPPAGSAGFESGKSNRPKKGKSKRKCIVCGRDPWPNYYYCTAHHRGKEDEF